LDTHVRINALFLNHECRRSELGKSEITTKKGNFMTKETDDVKAVEALGAARDTIVTELRKTIVGMDDVIDEMMIAIFSRGHCLLVGVPGLAKTLLVSSLAETMSLSFKRIQFTPDLMPSDITGTELLQEDPETHERKFKFQKGPVFTNLLLADEINRTPPKTQAALLEAMQEKRVTVGGKPFHLEPPFFVLATQNPIELEGTYPLPEAQLDRFMLNIIIDYLEEEEEVEVVNRTTGALPEEIAKTVSGEDIVRYQDLIRRIPAADEVTRYAVRLVRASRPGSREAPDFVNEWLRYGASLRASQYLILGGKARALMHGRYNVACEDVRALAGPVLRHRILTNFQAESENIKPDEIINRLLETVPLPKSGL
jgi:MoxR-like ATPase